MNPRFDVGESPEGPDLGPEAPLSAPEIPAPELPTSQAEEAGEDKTEAAGPEMVIEGPPETEITSQEVIQELKAPEPTRIVEGDITRRDIDLDGAADLQGRISGANQP